MTKYYHFEMGDSCTDDSKSRLPMFWPLTCRVAERRNIDTESVVSAVKGSMQRPAGKRQLKRRHAIRE